MTSPVPLTLQRKSEKARSFSGGMNGFAQSTTGRSASDDQFIVTSHTSWAGGALAERDGLALDPAGEQIQDLSAESLRVCGDVCALSFLVLAPQPVKV